MKDDRKSFEGSFKHIDRLVQEVRPIAESVHDDSAQRLVPILRRALESQSEAGWWGQTDEPRMRACYTAQTLDALVRIGFARTARHPSPIKSKVDLGVQWLLENKGSDGLWGEDLWDTCEVIRLLVQMGVEPRDPRIEEALERLRIEVDENWKDSKTGADGRKYFWFGASFPSVAVQTFFDVGDVEYATRALRQVMALREDGGCFGDGEQASSALAAPPEWHTASAILAMEVHGSVAPDPENLDEAVRWLKSRQQEAGFWSSGKIETDAYLTRLCVVALVAHEKKPSESTRLATEWLVGLCEQDNYESISNVLMALSSISRTHNRDLVVRVSASHLTNLYEIAARCEEETEWVRSTLQNASDELLKKDNEIERLKSELKGERERGSERDRQLEKLSEIDSLTAFRVSKIFATSFGVIVGAISLLVVAIRFRVEIFSSFKEILNL